MPRDRVPLCSRGYTPRSDPQTLGGLASGLEGLVPRGRSPGAPVPLGTGNQSPQPLSSTTYLRGEEVCLASRLGQIDVAEAN